jgi:N-acetylneuraminic acid mutarotase
VRILSFLLVAMLAGCVATPAEPIPTNEVPAADGFVDLWPDTTWKELAPAPTYRTENAVGIAAGKLYSVGGMTNETTEVTLVEVYDIEQNTWSRGPDYPIPSNHLTVVGVGPKVYAFGGLSGVAATNLAFVLDPALGRWTPLPAMPTPRAAHGAVAIAGKIYLVGGYFAVGQHTTDTHVFDTATNTWTIEPGPPTQRDHTGAALVDGKIYLMAGDINGHGSNTQANEVYDPATKTWTKLAPVPTLRGSNVAVPFRGRVLAIGGQNATDVFDDVEAYDPTTDTWTILTPLSKPRHGFQAGTWEGIVYLVTGGHEPGGLPGQQTSNSLEALTST